MSHPDVSPSDAAYAQRLVARMAEGDAEALRLLYETHGARIVRFLHALTGDRHIAEDLTQETFLAAWGAAARYRPRAPVDHWLFTIARRLGWRQGSRRRRSLERLRARQATAETPPPSAPDARLVRQDEVRRLHEALASIEPRLRLVFVLVRIAGCTYVETARIAGLPVGTVKSRMSTAEQRLRHLLAPTLPQRDLP